MAKTVNAAAIAALESPQLASCILVKVVLPTDTIRLTNAGQNIYWDEDGVDGEEEYIGWGNLLNLSTLAETTDLGAQTFEISLTGVSEEFLQLAIASNFGGSPSYIYYAALDTELYSVIGGETGPLLICAGRLDFMNIIFGETSSVTANITSRLADWERQHGGRYNNEYQTTYVDENDKGFRYVHSLQNRKIVWGEHYVDPWMYNVYFGQGR